MATAGVGRWVDVRTHANIEIAHGVLKSKGFKLIAAHPAENALDFREIDYTQAVALLVGSELFGVSERALELCDHTVSIPMQGMVASLNVSVATAIILSEAERQRRSAGRYERRSLADDEFERTLFEWAHPRIAKFCRDKNKPYPAIDEDGFIIEEFR